MEKDSQWVEGRAPSGFGPVESLTLAFDANNPDERFGPDMVYPIRVGLVTGDAQSFVEKVEKFTRAVNASEIFGKPIENPVLAIPPFHLPMKGDGYDQKGETKQAPPDSQGQQDGPPDDGIDPEWISLLVTGDFLLLLSVPANAIEAENPIGDVWQFDLSLPVPLDALPEDAEGAFEPLPAVSVPDGPPPTEFVVTAVIDDGLPIANTRFRRAMLDSRVAYAWVQDGKHRGGGSHVHYGREFTKAQIDGLLASSVVGSQVDEDKFYRDAKITDFGAKHGRTRLAARFTHGANVMDQGAGYEIGAAEFPGDNPIISVQLPAAVTADTSGLSLDGYVQDALLYILDRADRIAKDLGGNKVNLVINFSYGFIAGPHDGTHPLELLMDGILKKRNAKHQITAITLPAGNSRQSMCHGQVKGCNKGGPTIPSSLTWHVLPDDRTPSYGILYMPTTIGAPTSSRVQMRLRTPTGVLSPPLPEQNGMAWEWRINGGPVLAKLSYQYIGHPTHRGRFVVAVRPTRALKPDTPTVPSGNWEILVENVSLGSDEVIECYIQRDDTPFGFVGRGRQSHFLDPNYQRYTVQGAPVDHDSPAAYVKRNGTLNGLATGHRTAVMGGFDRVYGQPALYSAAGPALPDAHGTPPRTGPNVAGISDTTRVHFGVFGATTRSGSVFALNGTSVASPQIGRRIAVEMANGNWSGVSDIDDWVDVGPPYWPNPLEASRVGKGRVLTNAIYPVRRVDV